MAASRFITAGALVLISTACAPLSQGAGDVIVPSPSRSYITAEEIRAAASATALDAVRALRPTWLVKRGPQSVSYESDIIVYLDRARLGGVRALSEIAAGSVTALEFLNPAQANYRFGAGHPYGAIVASTRDP